MRIGDLGSDLLRERLAGSGVSFQLGPYAVRVRGSLSNVPATVSLVGAQYPLLEANAFIDFELELRSFSALPNHFAKRVRLIVDGNIPFESFPIYQAYALLEWGINWCVATRSDRYLLIHAAVVEKDGFALLCPAPPGSGKSTLCAALVCRGWRLLSDEVGMLTGEGTLTPIPRPVSLKNASIDLIRQFEPSSIISGITHATAKGTIAYMRPPADSVDRQSEPATPRWIVFPKYEGGAALKFEPYPTARTLVYLAHNSFNYHIHGARGFELLGNVLDHCDCYRLTYGSLEDALVCIESLAATSSPTIPSAA